MRYKLCSVRTLLRPKSQCWWEAEVPLSIGERYDPDRYLNENDDRCPTDGFCHNQTIHIISLKPSNEEHIGTFVEDNKPCKSAIRSLL